DGRDAGVEVPAALKVVADALDGLVEFALDLTRLRREGCCGWRLGLRPRSRRGISCHETIDSAQESLDAFDAGVLPVEVAIGRSGEEAVEACGVRAITRNHFIRTDHVAQALRHFCAVFDDH